MDLKILPSGERRLKITATELRHVRRASQILRAVYQCGVAEAKDVDDELSKLLERATSEHGNSSAN